MGIKGSSTVQIYFENVKVPIENLLGEREEGFKNCIEYFESG
jgi:alkylation response protein AidB-like acyl-CoA dehydrogenase